MVTARLECSSSVSSVQLLEAREHDGKLGEPVCEPVVQCLQPSGHSSATSQDNGPAGLTPDP